MDTSWLQDASRDDASEVGVPTSFVLLSEDTGARTIVSSRCGLKVACLLHDSDVVMLRWVGLCLLQHTVEICRMAAAERKTHRNLMN